MKILIKLLIVLLLAQFSSAQESLFSLDTAASPIKLKFMGDAKLLYWKYPGSKGGKGLSFDLNGSNNLAHYQIFWPWPVVKDDKYLLPLNSEVKIYLSPLDKSKPVDLNIEIIGSICDEKSCLPYLQTISKQYSPCAIQETSNAFELLQVNRVGHKIIAQIKFLNSQVTKPKFILGSDVLTQNAQVVALYDNLYELTWSLPLNTDIDLLYSQGEILCDQVPGSKPIAGFFQAGLTIEYFLMSIIFAIAGGCLLNLMPCTLPIFSLKLLALSRHPLEEGSLKWHIIGHFATFNLIALGSILLKAFGKEFAWGMHFQNPSFVILMSIIMVIMISSSLDRLKIGVFEDIAEKLGAVDVNKQFLADFLNGAITSLMSISCGAPLLVGAVGVALSNGSVVNVLLFNFIALGFSAPYIMIAYFPNVVRFIPKSGPWLAKFKLFITLALTLTLIWLLYIFHGQIGAMALIGLVGILVLIKGLIESENKFLNIKFIQISLFIMLSSAALYFPAQLSARYAIYDQYKDSLWQNFTRQALQDALNQNKVVFVDITADWCGTCKYNKAMVLDRSWTVNMLASKKVVALRGSLNVANYQASRFMQEAGAHMIPFNIVYGPGAPNGITLPVIYSYNDLKDAVMKASDK